MNNHLFQKSNNIKKVKSYCRFDWRLDVKEKPKLLEVNPNPGWCWDGYLAKMSKLQGLDYSQMLGKF